MADRNQLAYATHRLTWHRLARSERDPRRSRAAKYVTNSNAVFGAVVAFVTGKAKRPAQSRSAATQLQNCGERNAASREAADRAAGGREAA